MSAALILIVIAFILIALCIIAGAIASVRAAAISGGGQYNARKLSMSLSPLVAYGIGYAITRGLVDAAIVACLLLLAVCILTLIATGIRGAFMTNVQ
jgi:hypothetical protein